MEADTTAATTGKTAVNRERAERRRAVARTVKDVRERLTSLSGIHPSFDYDLAGAFARTRLSAAFALPFLVLFVAATATMWISLPALSVWVAAILAIHGLIVWICRRFLASPYQLSELRGWIVRFVAADFLYGAAWAGLLFVTARGSGEGLEVFMFATALIVVSVGTMLASTVPAAAVAGSMPVTLALGSIFVSRGDLLFVVLAVLAVAAQSFFLILAGRMYTATVLMLESRAEKDVLIAELGTAKAISDESRRRAEEANLAKSRFLATMSHELRTPLNAILGFSEVMKNEVLGPIENPAYRDYSNDIHTSGQHLLNLINEILDLSRIEAGRYDLNEEPVQLAFLAEECQHLIQLKARAKSLTLTVQCERQMPRLWADERAVRQVILNLLSNAIKFTQPGGEIWLKVGWTAGGGQYVSVSDNGPGIPEEEIPIVLSTFGQGSIAIKGAEQGTGLGLPIVQALMHTHDGTFELRSKLREGTEAIASFPRSRVMEALPPIAEPERRRRHMRDAG